MSHSGFPGAVERCWSPLKILLGRFSSWSVEGISLTTPPKISLVGLPTPGVGDDNVAVGDSCFCCLDFRNTEPPPEICQLC